MSPISCCVISDNNSPFFPPATQLVITGLFSPSYREGRRRKRLGKVNEEGPWNAGGSHVRRRRPAEAESPQGE